MCRRYKLHNIKISFKFITSKPFILKNGLDLKNFSNFCVVKEIYSFVIFKPKKNSFEQHCNVTKISNPTFIPHVIKTFLEFCKNVKRIDKLKIENTTSTIKLDKQIDLNRLYMENKKKMNLRYCSEKFPAVFFHPLTENIEFIFTR